MLGVGNVSAGTNPDFLDFPILKITCTPNTLFSTGFKLLQILETRILGSFEPGSEKGPSTDLCKSSKKGFSANRNKTLLLYCTLISWSSLLIPVLDFSFRSGEMSNLLNARIERPNNQEPALGTDERGIIFKTPF